MTVLAAAGSFVQRKPCRRGTAVGNDEPGQDPCGGAVFLLHCWCGWRGPISATAEAAVEAWQEHADQEGRQ